MSQRRLRQVILIAIVAAVLAGLRVLLPAPTARVTVAGSDDFGRYHDRTFLCTRVIDGDTFDVQMMDLHNATLQGTGVTRVRLWGLDTPELAHGQGQDQYFAQQATDYARNALEGKPIRLTLVEYRTRCYYGRLLAYAWLSDGTMYNLAAIRDGVGYADPRWNHPYRQPMLDAEAVARQRLTGLWAGVKRSDFPKWVKKGRYDAFLAHRPPPADGLSPASVATSQPTASKPVTPRKSRSRTRQAAKAMSAPQ